MGWTTGSLFIRPITPFALVLSRLATRRSSSLVRLDVLPLRIATATTQNGELRQLIQRGLARDYLPHTLVPQPGSPSMPVPPSAYFD